MNKLLIPLLFSSCFLLWSCSTTNKPEVPENATQCSEPRPQICTMQYVPVCATDKNGNAKTYSTDCNACTNPDVVYHQPEACKS